MQQISKIMVKLLCKTNITEKRKKIMLFEITFHIKIPKHLQDQGVFTKQLHGYLLNKIKDYSAPLSKEIHDNQQRQKIALFLMDKGIKVGTDNRVIEQVLLAVITEGTVITTPSFQGEVTAITSRDFPLITKVKQSFNKVKVNFESPTTFSQYGKYYPLPETQRIFSSALKVYNRIAPEEKKSDWEDVLPILHGLIIGKVKVETRLVTFNKYKINGYVGYVEYILKQLTEDEKLLIQNLFLCMQVMGVGSKTAMGLGKVSIEKR
jgi:CRISPR-associated endoribonuclease Cas6